MTAARTRMPSAHKQVDADTIAAWLGSLDGESLRELVRELAERDPDARRTLLSRARIAQGGAQSMRKAIDSLIGRPRFFDYRAARAYVRRLHDLVDTLRKAIARDPVAGLELTERALNRLIAVYEQSDDSGGAIGEMVHMVGALHLEAALGARPAPLRFAKSYLALRFIDQWSILAPLDAYVEVLTDAGIAALNATVVARLNALPPCGPDRYKDAHRTERFVLPRVLEELARHGGDLETLLAYRARTIESAWNYNQLSHLCTEHGREREAIAWLERGLKAYPDDTRLLDELAVVRVRDGFPEEAVELRWRAFAPRADAAAFLHLRDLACSMGTWAEWRERALARAELIEQQRLRGACDLRVALLLADDDAAGAWRLADEGALGIHVWARLAPALATIHPEGALRGYNFLLLESLRSANQRDYLNAVACLRHLRDLHRRLGTGQEFDQLLATLRVAHRPRRNFIALLDAFEQSRADPK